MTRTDESSGARHVHERVTIPLCIIIFFSVLNGMMFNVVIPDIAAEFHLLPSGVSWVMTGYILVFGLGSLIYGRLADHIPIRTLITVGLVLLNAGSLIGFFSTWYPMVIVARLVQAAGGAAIPALAMLVATDYLPVGIRGKVLGIFASTVAFAAAVGPIMGGFIAGALDWHYLFLVILGSMAALPSLLRLLPAEKRRPVTFDTAGAAFLGGGLGCLLFGLTTGTWWLFLPGLAGVALFLRQVFLSPHPLVPPALFFNVPFRSTIVVTFLAIGSVFGMMFAVPLMLRDTLGLDVTRIGLTLFPGAMSAAILGTVGGLISDRRGSGFVATAGMVISIGGFALLSTFAGFSAFVIAPVLIVSYAGFAFLQSSLPHAAATALPPEMTGVGMGFYNLAFFMSGAFTSATIGRLLDLRPGWFCLNPLATCVPGWPYSNVFFFLAAASAAALAIFLFTFKGKKVGLGEGGA